MRIPTGTVVPSTVGPHVEQVGWGVGRQVARVLREQGVEGALLEALPDLAEQPEHAAYAVFRGRTATALALVRLDGAGAAYAGDALGSDADPSTRDALVVRALHDAAAAGRAWLEVPDDLVPAGLAGLGAPVVPDA